MVVVLLRRLHGLLAMGGLVVAFASFMPAAFAEPTLSGARAKTSPSATVAPDPAARRRPTPRRDGEATATARVRELDQMRREDVAAQLALLGVALKWQDHTLAELVDWRDRIDAAVTLRVQYRVDLDWRTTSLRELIEVRLRAAKASELASLYDVHVDWRRYSWVALEGLRRRVARLPRSESGGPIAADGLATPAWSASPRRQGRRPQDPDAIIEPTFAVNTPPPWSRQLRGRGKYDPDAILIPTFATVSPPPAGPDDVIDPWAPRSR